MSGIICWACLTLVISVLQFALHGQFHDIYFIKREISRQVHVVRRATNETASNIKIWSFVFRNLEKYVKELENEEKVKLDKWKIEAG